ncbi:MAG: tetraacyldisaccharide 4'-kinase [Alphaproteobacteria bacterium]|nr:tetraacyldisaccharide 4'-kinase [Alphaproteobacteria bacterium]
MRAPEFWHTPSSSLPAALLAPLGAAYGTLARLRDWGTTPWCAPVPVICVGNLTVGGAGKTPTVLALAARLQDQGIEVACLSRGYGGREHGPLRVDPARHTAAYVGDEPLLLAGVAPTWIARDRRGGAQTAIAEGADIVLLDDGLQNPSLRKDLSLVVIDGGYGFGNGRVLPAGPLREPVERGLARAHAVVLIGDDSRGVAMALPAGLPILRARLEPDEAALRLRGCPVVAFAGIGRPAKFFHTLREIGAEVIDVTEFADHHPYTADEIMRLAETAQHRQATLVTTAKDLVRLPEPARALATAVGVRLRFADPAVVDRLLMPLLGAVRG